MSQDEVKSILLESVDSAVNQTDASDVASELRQTVLKDELQVRVVIGHTQLNYQSLLSISVGETLVLDTAVDAPVSLYVGEQCIGTGELVVVNDQFAVRLLEIFKL